MALLIGTYAPLGAVAVLTTLPVIWLGKRFGRDYSRISRRVQDQQGDLATLTEEAASGMRVVKAFGRGPLMEERFGASARTLRASSVELANLRGQFWGWLTMVPNLTMAAAVLVGGIAVARGSLSLGAIVAFTTLLVLLQFPIIDLGWILSMAQQAATAADRVCELFDAEMTVKDRPSAVPLVAAEGGLSFEGVGFSYPGSTVPVLRDVSLQIEPGETVAIVGLTGSGKSTLASLPARLYDVTSGRITLDGHDIRDLTIDSLRRHVGMVFEDPVLFSMSVRENLVLGRPGASDQEITDVLELAQAEFVYDLPWGLDTRIGEQGLSLSGGQRQRLALGESRHRPPGGARARRPALRPRRQHRVARREEPRQGAPRHDGPPRGAPPLHGGAGEPRRPAARRRPRRRGHAPRADGKNGLRQRAVRRTRAHEGAVVSSTEAWRGVGAEEAEEVSRAWAGLLRKRTRRLLASITSPHRRTLILLAVVIFVANAASVAVPYLVGVGIDWGIPGVRRGNYVPISLVTGIIVACSLAQAFAYRAFVAGSGRVGQEMLLELRERVFAHFQRLSLAFHDRYTTGRMISRLTSDLEAINDMFSLGLDTLVTAVLAVVSVGVILLVLDLPLGLVCLSGFIPLWFLTRWYQRRRAPPTATPGAPWRS